MVFAATVFWLVTALAVPSTVQAIRISRERDRANQEAASALRVSDFLQGLFRVSDPSEAKGSSVTARELLDSGFQRIRTELRDDPVVQARLMRVIGEVYCGLGMMREARPLVEEALEVYEATEGPDGLEVANALHLLGVIDWTLGENRRALDLHRRALSIYERKVPPGDRRLARASYLVGTALMYAGRWAEAEAALRRGVELADAGNPPLPVFPKTY